MRSWVLLLAYAAAIGAASWGAWNRYQYRRTVVYLLRAILDALRQEKHYDQDQDRQGDDDAA